MLPKGPKLLVNFAHIGRVNEGELGRSQTQTRPLKTETGQYPRTQGCPWDTGADMLHTRQVKTLPELLGSRHDVECLLRIQSADLTPRRPLPVYPNQRTFP